MTITHLSFRSSVCEYNSIYDAEKNRVIEEAKYMTIPEFGGDEEFMELIDSYYKLNHDALYGGNEGVVYAGIYQFLPARLKALWDGFENDKIHSIKEGENSLTRPVKVVKDWVLVESRR